MFEGGGYIAEPPPVLINDVPPAADVRGNPRLSRLGSRFPEPAEFEIIVLDTCARDLVKVARDKNQVPLLRQL